MKTYKVSELFKRAKQLADLEGSDFITWNEAINCINESYVGLFQKLINMGDNSYVGDFHTKELVEKLPEDFWQLKGVYLWNNGNLQTINRRADNNGTHHLSYELRNGELRIFGQPNDVYIEYFKKPMTLLMPPADKEITLNLPEGSTILDCCEHTFLYVTQNELEEDILCIYDIDGIKNATGILPAWDNDKTYITKNYVFAITESGLDVYDMAIGDSTLYPVGTVPIITKSGELYLITTSNEIIDFEGKTVKEFTPEEGAVYYVANDDLTDFYALVENDNEITVYHNETDTEQNAKRIIYADNKCYFLAFDKFGVIEEDEGKTLKTGVGNSISFISINENTGYGYATRKYNKVWVCPYCEDTELNFPNSFYYQMLSYLLAIAFRSKQGADISLLSAQLDMVAQTFEDTLGSDSYQFPRMGNVYN